jgi:hypothetical protein
MGVGGTDLLFLFDWFVGGIWREVVGAAVQPNWYLSLGKCLDLCPGDEM